jgi:putative flavoprotein involved in K+ transport
LTAVLFYIYTIKRLILDEKVDILIVGGGQAGLSLSYYLLQQKREHLVLEKADAAGEAWRNHRWDSFTLVTPNWGFCLPGAAYQDGNPHGFMPKNEIVRHFEDYAEQFHIPVRYSTIVTAVEHEQAGTGFLVRTEGKHYRARSVVIATGLFQQGKIPAFAAQIPSEVAQLHSGDYRNPESLPPGAVLVVGAAQSGAQIAEELYQNGRKVYLCTGSAIRMPRRYRGRDIYEWAHLTGFLDRTLDQLPSPAARFAGNPGLSGKDGGHTLNLHQFFRDGVTLLGHLRGVQDGKLLLAPDLKENLAKVDQGEASFLRMVDEHILKHGIDAPEDSSEGLQDGFAAPEILTLDLKSAGIGTIIWACGYTFDYEMVKLPVTDDFGFPLSQHGETPVPGLYFLGMPWIPSQKTGLLLGIGEAAAHLAEII